MCLVSVDSPHSPALTGPKIIEICQELRGQWDFEVRSQKKNIRIACWFTFNIYITLYLSRICIQLVFNKFLKDFCL